MLMTDELKQIMAVAETWTREPFDAETRAQVKKMMEESFVKVVHQQQGNVDIISHS